MEEIQKYQSNMIVTYAEMERMAQAIAKSQLFGLKTVDQVIAIMLVCQAEGLHPAIAARDYDVIQGRPALKAKAKLARFQRAGGVFKWIFRTDTECSAEFSHPSCPLPTIITWDLKRATAAGLGGKDNWKKYPRQMLSARVISEGVDATYPDAGGLMYVPEEIQDFDVIDDKPKIQLDLTERNYTAEFEGCETLEELKYLYESLSSDKKKELTALKNHCKKQIEIKTKANTKEEPKTSNHDIILTKISNLSEENHNIECPEIEIMLDNITKDERTPYLKAYFNKLNELKIDNTYEPLPL